MDGVRLRPATAKDAAACAELVRTLSVAFFEHADGLGTEPFLTSIDAERQASYIDQYRYLVADTGKALVGLVALRPPRHLFHLFVAQHWQGNGLGRQLLEAVLNAGDASLPLTVNASLTALGFYRRQGFEPVGPAQTKDGVRFQPMTRPAA